MEHPNFLMPGAEETLFLDQCKQTPAPSIRQLFCPSRRRGKAAQPPVAAPLDGGPGFNLWLRLSLQQYEYEMPAETFPLIVNTDGSGSLGV